MRLRPWAQVAVAAAAWLIMADAAFFDVYASPFSEPAALLGLPLFAAGVVYLGRGLACDGVRPGAGRVGGLLAILAKEQYLAMAVPICLTLALANATWGWPAPAALAGSKIYRLLARPRFPSPAPAEGPGGPI